MIFSLKLITVAVLALIIIYLASLSFMTRQHKMKAENERHLTPCPDKPNCVSSLTNRKSQVIEPFTLLQNNPEQSWEKLVSSIQQSGGEILLDDGRYLHAVFTSAIFRFKDDLEGVMNDKKIDIRSASRAGKSDLGKNRERVERIRGYYEMTSTLEQQ